jgi:hypothetical protein
LKTAHGNVREIEVDATCREGAAVCKVDFGTVVGSGTTYWFSALHADLIRSGTLTTPLGISITGAAINDFENYRGSVANFSNYVVGTVGVRLGELETFSTG